MLCESSRGVFTAAVKSLADRKFSNAAVEPRERGRQWSNPRRYRTATREFAALFSCTVTADKPRETPAGRALATFNAPTSSVASAGPCPSGFENRRFQSTVPAGGPRTVDQRFLTLQQQKSGRRDSNPRHLPWQGSALPTELHPQACTARDAKNIARPPSSSSVSQPHFSDGRELIKNR